MAGSLSLFSPLVQTWFAEQLGEPTEVQERGWPGIVSGRHVIATAPTGSGKTLAAFLWAIDQLLTGAWPCGELQVIYISPLKALNNDIQRNLLSPLQELRARMTAAGMEPPDVRVAVRSGDTDQSERARMLRRPPEILITTPESLNLLVNSKRGRAVFGSVRTLILDEVHSVAATKRGAHLITAVDRLVMLSGEFQRLALSATINPLEVVAEWVAGRRLETRNGQSVFVPRDIDIVECSSIKKLDVCVRYPAVGEKAANDKNVWLPYAKAIREVVRQHHEISIA
ncbi:MAG: DEAD/DEAH box helicase [Candidatus Hinthialibacter antarcticus]|nr:DEAD/DEAH box helicase [Candidatus Hinthialibacter antarcticus]